MSSGAMDLANYSGRGNASGHVRIYIYIDVFKYVSNFPVVQLFVCNFSKIMCLLHSVVFLSIVDRVYSFFSTLQSYGVSN